MAKPVVLGNNGLTVALNEYGLVHDFYYPYVGLENLTSARKNPHYVGIWIDEKFSWISDDSWERDINFRDDALVGYSTMTNSQLQIKLVFEDFVDANNNIFARKVEISNLADHTREIRIFFHQFFQLSSQGRSDTALYEPDGHYILDYKGRCSILAYAEEKDGLPFDQYAVGNTGIEGKEGTFKDAEDGELSNSAVEHSSVDSTIRCKLIIDPNKTKTVHYWLAVSDSQTRLEAMHSLMLGAGFENRLKATYRHWHDWLLISSDKLNQVNPKYRIVLQKSMLIIKSHIDIHGGIIASCDSSIYNYGRDYYSYVWPRDGAYVLWPLIKMGHSKEAKAFFRFCSNIIHVEGYLMHKYQPDKAVGSTWHPLVHGRRKELAIQEDETAVVIFMLSEYLKYFDDGYFAEEMYDSLVRPAADFMSRFIDAETNLPHASYDLWEEKFLTSTYTAAVTAKALQVASEMAINQGIQVDADKWHLASERIKNNSYKFFDKKRKTYIKGYLMVNNEYTIDKTLDVSSFYGTYKYNYGPEDKMLATLKLLEEKLLDKSPSGGSPRYEYDRYFKSDPAYLGNPWYVTTLWLAQYYARNSQLDKAFKYIDWAIGGSMSSGSMSEQLNPSDKSIVGVTPLIWSHAELINTILETNS